jgi:pyridoxine 5-phosphate synthase
MHTLAVNVDHVATVRQARLINEPDPVIAAALAELAGCHAIIVHLREDRRHIQDRDVEVLKRTVKTRLSLEMAATDAMIAIACRIRPHMACLVPEKREELTTEGGLDVAGQAAHMRRSVKTLQEAGCMVSLFIDAAPDQIKAACDSGAECIEIHTGHYADAKLSSDIDREFNTIVEAIEQARALGLRVNAGHGLNYYNTQRLVPLAAIEEFSIGHSIIARAVLVGIERAVREMLDIING